MPYLGITERCELSVKYCSILVLASDNGNSWQCTKLQKQKVEKDERRPRQATMMLPSWKQAYNCEYRWL